MALSVKPYGIDAKLYKCTVYDVAFVILMVVVVLEIMRIKFIL